MLDLLEEQLGFVLDRPWHRSLPGGGRLEVDGGCEDPQNALLVEVWAHQGPPKLAKRPRCSLMRSSCPSLRPCSIGDLACSCCSATTRPRRPSARHGPGRRQPFARRVSK